MSDEILEPSLTKQDRRVLGAVSACGSGDGWRRRAVDEAVSLWEIAEALDTRDLDEIARTLQGLHHLGYVCAAESRSRKRRVYWRTRKGDEEIAR